MPARCVVLRSVARGLAQDQGVSHGSRYEVKRGPGQARVHACGGGPVEQVVAAEGIADRVEKGEVPLAFAPGPLTLAEEMQVLRCEPRIAASLRTSPVF